MCVCVCEPQISLFFPPLSFLPSFLPDWQPSILCRFSSSSSSSSTATTVAGLVFKSYSLIFFSALSPSGGVNRDEGDERGKGGREGHFQSAYEIVLPEYRGRRKQATTAAAPPERSLFS